MIKWIGGGCLVLVLIAACVMYFGYRKVAELADQPPVATITIAASPERVFASLANADSLSTWSSSNGTLNAHHGVLVAGDTLRFARAKDSTSMTAVIADVVLNKLLVTRRTMMGKPGNPANLTMERRDSLVTVGDSTRVVSTMSAAMNGASGPAAGMMATATKMMVAAMRMEAEQELAGLKGHIEGKAATSPDSGKVKKP